MKVPGFRPLGGKGENARQTAFAFANGEGWGQVRLSGIMAAAISCRRSHFATLLLP